MFKIVLLSSFVVLFMLTSETRPAEYVVLSGDTVNSIADKLGTTPDALKRINSLDKRNYIRAGQTLKYVSRTDLEEALDFWKIEFSRRLKSPDLTRKEKRNLEYTAREIEFSLFRAISREKPKDIDHRYVLDKEKTAAGLFKR
ncbi:MAG: LysM domain-containing protein [Candidatus Falkowbacteria bacterium]